MDFLAKQRSLPEPVNTFFSSDNPRLELERSCFMYGVRDEKIKNISGPVGLIFVDDVKLEDLPKIISEKLQLDKNMANGLAYEINKRIFKPFLEHFTDAQKLLDEWSKQKAEPIISEDAAWQKVLEIEPWILEEQMEEKKAQRQVVQNLDEAQTKLEKMTLTAALQKYPEINEQLITSSRINIKSFSEPARPNVKNWLSDYTFTMGFDAHDSAARGIYLFRNENTKILNQVDKDKLNYLLRAYDTAMPVEINLTLKQIIFPPRFDSPQFDKTPRQSEAGPRVTRGNASAFTRVTADKKAIVIKPSLVKAMAGEAGEEEKKEEEPEDIFAKLPTFLQKTFWKSSAPKKVSAPLSSPPEKALPGNLPPSEKTAPKLRIGGTFTISRASSSQPLKPKAEMEKPLTHETILPSARNMAPKTDSLKINVPVNLPTVPPKTPTSLGKVTVPAAALVSKPKIEFTSPQKLPFEKQLAAPEAEKEVGPQPIKITPINFHRDLPSKNIVDLKK